MMNIVNWHKYGFIVDIKIDYVNSEPKIYKILKCYFDDIIEL